MNLKNYIKIVVLMGPDLIKCLIYLNSENYCVHQVLGRLYKGGGRVQGGDHHLALLEADLGLDLAADVQLVAVESHSLQVGQKVPLGP